MSTSPSELKSQVNLDPQEFEFSITASSAFFGADLSRPPELDSELNDVATLLGRPEGLPVYKDTTNTHGCELYNKTYHSGVIIVNRGICTFLTKLKNARAANASAVIVISDDEVPVNPSAGEEDLEEAAQLNDTAMVLLTKTAGKTLLDMMDVLEEMGTSEMRVALPRAIGQPRAADGNEESTALPEPQEDIQETHLPKDTGKVLYINGHALLNTRLLV